MMKFEDYEEQTRHEQLLFDIKIESETEQNCLSHLTRENVNEMDPDKTISDVHSDYEHDNRDNSLCNQNLLEKNYSSTDISNQSAENVECSSHASSKESDMRNEVKDFECKVCHKTFTRKHNLKLHVSRHTSITDDYHCSVCSKVFMRRNSLARHMKTHNGIQDFRVDDDLRSETSEERNDHINFVDVDSIYIKEENNFADNEEQNIHDQLLSDTKKESDNEQDCFSHLVNEDLNKTNQGEIISNTHTEIINSVYSLIAKPFYSRSSTEKNEIKRLGRPTPNLNIKQSVSSKKRTFNRTFNPDIYNKHTWICGCEVKNALFCFPCLLFGGEESWTKIGFTDLNHLGDRIKKHTLTAKHMRNVMKFSLFGTDITTQLDNSYRRNIQLHNEKVRHNRNILNNLINCVRFCGAFELAMRDEFISSSNPGIFRGLINFTYELDVVLKEHLEKATVFKGSKSIQNEILQTMFSVCQEEISKEIKEADYLSLIVDETSDNIYQIAIVFRYITRGKPVERFWDFLTPSDDTKTMSSSILTELEKHIKNDKRKLIAQTYDGAAVMGGVQVFVKQTYEHAAYVHCYAHQINFVMLNAASANTNVRIFLANLQGICTFFSSSPKYTAILNGTVKKRLPCSIPNWNFQSGIVCTIFLHKQDIIETMRNISNKNKNSNIINQASGYIAILTSENFIFWLNLFYKIMPHVDVLFAKFQKKEIDFVSANKYLLLFETQLVKIRDSITELQYTNDPSTTKRRKTNRDSYAREAKEVCNIIICQAKDRFHFTGHLIAATLFFSEKFSHYNTCFPDKNFQEIIKVYPFLKEQKLRTELTVLYETEEFRLISGLLLYSQNSELSETFSETLKLLKILITIPMTSTEEERCFSTLKKIKIFLRNIMSQESDKTLSALTMLSQERDLIESIPNFNQRVIDKFAATEDRHIDFLFQ